VAKPNLIRTTLSRGQEGGQELVNARLSRSAFLIFLALFGGISIALARRFLHPKHTLFCFPIPFKIRYVDRKSLVALARNTLLFPQVRLYSAVTSVCYAAGAMPDVSDRNQLAL
jgi:hypothetical protein